MANDKDFKVKNGIQPTVYHEGVGTVVSGSEGYSLSSASYDSKSFSVASQEGAAGGVQFKSDGTKMYVCGQAADSTFQYSLSTPYDVSTASYDNVSFNHTAQVSNANCYDLFFKTDGTQMYVMLGINDTVYQYTMSTAWDLSTASYASKNFSVSSQESGEPGGLAFSNDGTKMYVVGEGQAKVFQYTLSSAWDLSTASYASKSFSVSSKDTKPSGIAFSTSGDKMFISGENTDNIYLFSLSTPFDVTTASFSVSLDISAKVDRAWYVSLANDGKKMYVGGIGTTGGVSNNTIHQYSTVQTTNTLDLSTGSVFEVTPTSDSQITLSNPAASGTVSQATLLLSGEEATGVGSTFSTTLYTGNNSTQTVTNGIDLSGDGGLVWIKNRTSGSTNHSIFDTESGATGGTRLRTNLSNGLQAFNGSAVFTTSSTGFALNNDASNDLNDASYNYVSWTFKKQTKFFDIQTWTGDGASTRTISHNLDADIGSVFIKGTNETEGWIVAHRSTSAGNKVLSLNTTGTEVTANHTYLSGSTLTVGTAGNPSYSSNDSGITYVAYLFAHDTAADSIIKCGSYTGDGTTNGSKEVDLGFEPQWLIVKKTSGSSHWYVLDVMRGLTDSSGAKIEANTSDAEDPDTSGNNAILPSASGFRLFNTNQNASGSDYIYIAIRSPFVPTLTYDPDLNWSTGTAPTSPAIGETDVITFSTTDGGTSYQAVQAIDGAK